MEARSWIPLVVLLACGCADETIVLEPAEFGELCGEVGPVRILALDPDRPLASVSSSATIEERRILYVTYLGDEESPFEGSPPIGEREQWSVGPCGEEPLLLAAGDVHLIYDGKVDYYPESAWPEVPLVCDETTGQISAVDPTGVRPSNLVFEAADCSLRKTDDGVLTIVPHDEESAALVLQRWPEDPWTMKAEPVVVHDSVRLPAYPDMSHQGPGVTEADFLLITTADELVAVSRLDGELTTLATDVYEISFSHDGSGRYIAWRGTEVTNDDPNFPARPISLLDRETNEVTHLTDGTLTFGGIWIDELDIFSLWIDDDQVQRFYRLPSLESFDVPSLLISAGVLDDTRVLVGELLSSGINYSLLDMVTGELTPLSHGTGRIFAWDGNAPVLFDDVSADDPFRAAGQVWRVPLDGEAELLARSATANGLFTTDRRVVTPLAVGADWTGSLIVVDPATLDEQVIDEDVLVFRPMQDDLEVEGDPVILYGVAHPERQGVWLARLAP
jgi:hypothetical protein